MGPATSRGWLGLATLALCLTACGGSTGATSGVGSGSASSGAGSTSGFAWLRPQATPVGWRTATIPAGAAMAYPPTWRRQSGDAGTATAALTSADRRFLGYLNLTPRQGGESLTNWSTFRIDHNGEEGDRAIKRLAAATGLHFLNGQGSCVKDSYTTSVNARYIEIACLVTGPRGQVVIVGAAPPSSWAGNSAVIERAIEGVRT
jgi:hypothetical protein